MVTVEEKYAAEKKTWEKEEKPKFDASLAPVTKQRDAVVKEQGSIVKKQQTSYDKALAAQTKKEESHKARGLLRTSTRPTLNLLSPLLLLLILRLSI